MKKILTLNVKQLRTEECFGYLKQVVAETANLPIGGEAETPSEISLLSATNPLLETKVNEFTTTVDAFDDALKASSTNPTTATATGTKAITGAQRNKQIPDRVIAREAVHRRPALKGCAFPRPTG